MLINYFKIALRTLLKYKGFTTINLVGLSLGLTAGIFIMLYVVDELSYDNFHTKAERIFRVNTTFYDPGATSGSANETNGWPIGKKLEQYPETEAVLYTRSAGYLLINHEGKRIRQKLHYASPELLEIFSFPLEKGNPATALVDPYTVVISKDMEEKYFPNGDAWNKTLIMADTLQFTVTGVMQNIPANSHIQADMFVSFATYQKLESFSYDDGWGNINMRNYIILREGSDAKAFAAKAKNIYMDNVGDMMKEWGTTAYVEFEPLRDIYLKSKAGNGLGSLGSIQRVYMLTGIAVFVMLLACVNFINMATARSVYRAKEVGLRKVVGSSRTGLIMQFLGESFVITTFALLVSLALLGVLLPFFNQLLGKDYSLHLLVNPVMVLSILAVVGGVSFLSGYYPAWVISALRPAEVLKGKMQSSIRGIQLRRGLVVFQFLITVVLVAGTFVVIDQLRFMQRQDLGFANEQVLVVNKARVNAGGAEATETFIQQLKNHASIQEVSFANGLPGAPGWVGQIAYPEGKSGDETVSVEYLAIDDNYLTALELELVAGENFDVQKKADLENGLILNETAVIRFGWNSPEEAIGKKITSPSGTPEGTVIGVVRDYHQSGLQQNIRPVAMDYAPRFSYLFAIRYTSAETQMVLEDVQKIWKQIYPGFEFNYFFLDENFENQYQSEKRMANVLGFFAIITIVIASVGLLGLVSFMVVARTKEIGVRKVLGAGTFSLAKLLSKEFVVLVLLANLIAMPIVWMAAQEWLQTFAFRTSVNPLVFVYTLSALLVVTLGVVSIQTIKAALINPINSLRSE